MHWRCGIGKGWLALGAVLALLAGCGVRAGALELWPTTGQDGRVRHPRKDAVAVAVDGTILLLGGKSYPELYPWGQDGRSPFSETLPVERLDLGTMAYTDTPLSLPGELADPADPTGDRQTGLERDQLALTLPAAAGEGALVLLASGLSGRWFLLEPRTLTLRALPGVRMAERREDAVMVRLGGRVYVLGGLLDGLPVRGVEALDLASRKLVTGFDPLPERGGREDLAAVALGRRIYLFGGKSQDHELPRTVWSFDPAAPAGRQWRAEVDDPLPRGLDHAAAATVGDVAYLVSGIVQGDLQRQVLSFSPQRPAGRRWQRTGTLPWQSYRGALAVAGESLFLISGFTLDPGTRRGQLALSDRTLRLTPGGQWPVDEAGPGQPGPAPGASQPLNLHLTLPDEPAPDGARTLTVSYHPHPLDDSCIVRYRPDDRSDGWEQAESTPRPGSRTETRGQRRVCHVRLPGLPPGSAWRLQPVTYHPEGSAPPLLARMPRTDDGLDFVLYGDAQGQFERLQLLNEELARSASGLPELVFFLGDMTNIDSQDEWDGWFAAMRPLAGIPWMPVVGNHELFHSPSYLGQFDLPTEGVAEEDVGRWYALPVGDALFLVLLGNDSSTFPAQQAWAAERLARSRAAWRMALIHQPPVSSGHHGSDLRQHVPGPDGRSLLDVLERGGVGVVFSGHDHHYERTVPARRLRFDGRRHRQAELGRGVVYFVSGGAGAESYTPRPRAQLPGGARWLARRKPDPDRGEDERTHPVLHYLRGRTQGETVRFTAVEVDAGAPGGVADDGFAGVLDEVVLRRLPRGGVTTVERATAASP